MSEGGWWLDAAAVVDVSRAPVVQVAADGCWEAALSASWEQAEDVPDLVRRAAALGLRDVAIEVLWPGGGFVGARWSLEQVQTAADAGRRAAVLIAHAGMSADASPDNGEPVTAALAALLDGLPGRNADRVEVGAVNAWASVGPQLLWQRGRPEAGLPLNELPGRRPDLCECRHPVALEIAATEPRACWVGVVVSTQHGLVHRLDLSRAARLTDQVVTRPG
ncbi:MAG: hypothetical protein ACR2JG_11885 [Geodermatophilaceae bacterium]